MLKRVLKCSADSLAEELRTFTSILYKYKNCGRSFMELVYMAKCWMGWCIAHKLWTVEQWKQLCLVTIHTSLCGSQTCKSGLMDVGRMVLARLPFVKFGGGGIMVCGRVWAKFLISYEGQS